MIFDRDCAIPWLAESSAWPTAHDCAKAVQMTHWWCGSMPWVAFDHVSFPKQVNHVNLTYLTLSFDHTEQQVFHTQMFMKTEKYDNIEKTWPHDSIYSIDFYDLYILYILYWFDWLDLIGMSGLVCFVLSHISTKCNNFNNIWYGLIWNQDVFIVFRFVNIC